MHRRVILAAGLLGLFLVSQVVARAADEQAKSDKPALILRVASLDHLRGDLRYLADLVGQAEKAKQFDELIKSKLGDKGLEGIDTKKPLGAYGWVGGVGIDSKGVFLIPIADEKAFVAFFSDTLDAKPEKGDDGVYTANVDKVPAPVYFRFANGYAYLTVRDKEVLDKPKLLTPETVLPAGESGALSLTANIDRIPENLKELAFGTIENALANAKDQELPHQTPAQKKLRDAAVDEVSAFIKSLFNNGGETTLRLDLDRQSGDLALTASVAGKPGSDLATTIRDLGQVKSVTASLLHKDSALKGELNVSLPDKLRTLLGPALKDAQKQALTRTKDEKGREVLATILNGVMPTLQAAELDTAIDMQGPGPEGLYTLVSGIKIKDKEQLEASFRKMADRFPKVIKLDVEKAGAVSIHRINPHKNQDPAAKRALGENPAYVAIRDDVMLVTAGDKGLDALKEALAIAPTTGKIMELQVAFSRLAPLVDDKLYGDVARKVFKDGKDNDRLRVTLEGGKALTLRLAIKAKLLQYVNEYDKAKKKN